MDLLGLGIAGFLLITLSYLSILESSIIQLSSLTLRVLAEKRNDSRYDLLSEISQDRRHFMIPLQYGIQLILAVLAVLVTSLILRSSISGQLIWAVAAMLAVVSVFRHLLPYLVTSGRAELLLLRLLPPFKPVYRVLCWVSWPMTSILKGVRESRERDEGLSNHEEEASEEEIQAYLGVGEEEGIFEREESELIQSALEFGSTLVREIMTPRNAIVAIEEGASRSELKSLIVTSKHSRIPVYREQLDQIVGIVYVRNLLSHLEPGQEDHPITPAINEVLTVPETKNVSELLKEMQSKAAQMTIVINEYGTVSGLVTVEDLLEEIVGDIRDEDEFGEVDLIQESAGTYVVRGGLEVEDLEKTLGLDFGEYAATTVSGLIVEQMGRVPNPGEHISKKGATFEILSADRRRILTIRVSLLQEQQTTSPDRVVDSN